MLIDKGITSGEVVTIKLTSGEELVAKLASETDSHYKLSKPLVLTAGPQGLGMAPYLFTVSPDKEINLNKLTVTVISPTEKDFADRYIQGTTGISLV
jgi:hypothetical protein